MKQIQKYLIDQDTYSEFENFKNYYKGIPSKLIEKIWNKYIKNSPFPKNINDVMICYPFEALFMIAAMLVDDGFGITYYEELGYKSYKTHYGGTHNPYDYSWFDEEYETGKDIFEYLQHKWIPANYEEFEEIYNICKKYSKILTVDRIWETCNNVFM